MHGGHRGLVRNLTAALSPQQGRQGRHVTRGRGCTPHDEPAAAGVGTCCTRFVRWIALEGSEDATGGKFGLHVLRTEPSVAGGAAKHEAELDHLIF